MNTATLDQSFASHHEISPALAAEYRKGMQARRQGLPKRRETIPSASSAWFNAGWHDMDIEYAGGAA